MGHYKGRIVEVLLESYQNAAARLACPVEATPRPGQYLQAHNPDDPMEGVPTSLFLSGDSKEKDQGEMIKEKEEIELPVAGPLPESWQPGTALVLRGPLGRGFDMPKRARRVALVALDGNPGRLLPLVSIALQHGAQVSLVCNETPKELPLAVEQQPLNELPSVMRWADYAAIDVNIEQLDEFGTIFERRVPRALAAEILVAAPMPCGGLAKCGICTVGTKQGPRLACEDGPVFPLREIL